MYPGSPGPQPIEFAAALAPDGSYWVKRDFLVGVHREHKDRVETATRIANGEWYVVWPDLAQTPEAPTVANLVEMGINHWSAIGGAILPQLRCPVGKTEDASQGKRGARKRERRLHELWERSNVSELAAMWWGDYAGSGSAILAAWANFEEPPAKRHPYMIRFDPRHAYPMKDNLGNITELLIARTMTKAELEVRYPEFADRFKQSPEDQVEEWFLYTPEQLLHIVADVSPTGRKNKVGVILVNEENKLGFVPAWEVVRPSFDGQRRGVFDQTMHIMRTMHRLMTLTIYSTEEQVYPPIAEFDVINPEHFGPGNVLHLRSSDGKIERVTSSSHFDVKDLIARLSDEARQQSMWPQQLGGEPGASINSARGIKASMGALDARLLLAHRQFEVGLAHASEFLLAIDEIYCSGDKTIFGDNQDRRDAESYNPERDVAGAWKVICTYGVGAGSDPASKEMRLHVNLGGRLISRETARDQLDFIDDASVEELRMVKEALRDAFVAGIIMQTQQGTLNLAAEVWKRIQKEDVEIDDVLEEVADTIMNPVPPPELMGAGGPAAGGAMEAAMAAESLARGGIPGNAEGLQGEPPPGAGLPPLAQLMGGAGSPGAAPGGMYMAGA